MSSGPGYNKLPQIQRTHLRIRAVPRSTDFWIVSIVMVELICLRCWPKMSDTVPSAPSTTGISFTGFIFHRVNFVARSAYLLTFPSPLSIILLSPGQATSIIIVINIICFVHAQEKQQTTNEQFVSILRDCFGHSSWS